MSTLIFLLIFAVAFILIKFLGADIAGGTGIDKPKRLKKPAENELSDAATNDDDGGISVGAIAATPSAREER